MDWTPFEQRPRPPQLAEVVITLDRMQRIEIKANDEAAIGTIFAWLMGQVSLARGVVFDGPGLLKDDGSLNETGRVRRLDELSREELQALFLAENVVPKDEP